MTNLFRRVFRRYAVEHQEIQRPGFTLVDGDGRQLGHLDRISLLRNRILLEGWTTARTVTITLDGLSTSCAPTLIREDAARALGFDPSTPLGFAISLPYREAPCEMTLDTGSGQSSFPITLPTSREVANEASALIWPFLRDVARAAPTIARWYLTRDVALRGRIKRALRLTDMASFVATFDHELLKAGAVAKCADHEINIVLPVYNALDLLPEVLDRVVRNTDLPWHLVLVEDCSSDPNVRPFLRSWIEALTPELRSNVTLIENETNLGFLESVNRGLSEVARDNRHVVLLNSDAFVPDGWATRLIHPILRDPTIASVTPMSNDAELCNVPVICARCDLKTGEADAIDAFARTLNPDHACVEAPTGVGFCMAMNHKFLESFPVFDTAFGRGYGEEVDWCQKTREKGGRHVIAGNLFVEHRGGVSFGNAEKLKLIQSANARIARRYPTYDAEVQGFISSDPARSVRLVLALEWAKESRGGAVPIYVAHSMGGGAEIYLQKRISEDIAAGENAVVLRVGSSALWKVELHTAQGKTEALVSKSEDLHALLAPLTHRHIVYSNGVGHADLPGLPHDILALKRHASDTIEVLLHDFLVVSPSFNLLGSDKWFAGVPPTETRDKAHSIGHANGVPVSLADWRKAWGKVLAQADEIVAFSKNSRSLFLQAYPALEKTCVVRPHTPDLSGLNVIRRAQPPQTRVIGVLGNIGFEKGAAVVKGLSRALAESGDAQLVLIGRIDPAYPLASPAIEHGSYQVADIPQLALRYGITDWLLPSIWPETFSFATHEALATGLPVWCFDLGAQAEAVAAAPNGRIIPLPEAPAKLTQAVLDAILVRQTPARLTSETRLSS